MGEYTFRLATWEDRQAVIQFMNGNWGSRHPLVNLPDFFAYYYKGENGRLHFVLAEEDGQIVAAAGYVPASLRDKPDVWVSIWVAAKGAQGAGMELMEALPRLTNCRTLASNNIRAEVRPLYEFLGNTTGRVGQFYRLAGGGSYKVARVEEEIIHPVSGSAALTPIADEAALLASGFCPPEGATPYKDMWYIARRFFAYPRQRYQVYGAVLPGEKAPRALLAAHTVPVEGTAVLRIADYIGAADFLPQLGTAIDGLMREAGAEYADLYCAGLPEDLLRRAGFAARGENSSNVLPNYLSPLLQENVEFYYATSRPEGFTLFRADGDQDRPNIPVE